MAFEYTNDFYDLINDCATNSSIANFKSFMFGKPEEINFDHNINFGDYSTAWTGTTPSNANSHDLCSLGYPRTELIDLYEGKFNWTFDIYACRLISDASVQTFTKAENFGGLDLKIYKMLQAFNSCTNRVLDSKIQRDYGMFNDKLMVVKATIVWELNVVCTTTEMVEETEVCVDNSLIDYSAF